MENFAMMGVIGAGTFGIIMRAVEKRSGDEYALKILKKKQI